MPPIRSPLRCADILVPLLFLVCEGLASGQSAEDIARALRAGQVNQATELLDLATRAAPESKEAYGAYWASLQVARAEGFSSAWLRAAEALRAQRPESVVLTHLVGWLAGELKLLRQARAAFRAIPAESKGPAILRSEGDLEARQDVPQGEALSRREDEVAASLRAAHQALSGARDAASTRQLMGMALGALLTLLVIGLGTRLARIP